MPTSEWEKEFDDKFVYTDFDDERGVHHHRSWRPSFQLPDHETLDMKDFITKVRAEARQEVLEEIESYIEHDSSCILNGYDQGRPTKDGGYEVQVRGKWYQTQPVDESPKCDCGLNDLLSTLKEIE